MPTGTNTATDTGRAPGASPEPALLIGWTTLPARADAERIAEKFVRERLAFCAQIDGPITSQYIWKNEFCSDQEFRLTLKFLPKNADVIEKRIHKNHPYEVPQWVVIATTGVSEKYLAWARGA